MRILALTLITALIFAGLAQANELTCERSHLSTPEPNLEQIAANLARLRFQIYQMPTAGEKARANDEFKTKYAEFESMIMNKETAERLFQNEMKRLSSSTAVADSKKSERKEREIRREELDSIDFANKMIFHEILPGKFKMGDIESKKVEVEITKPFAMMATQTTQIMWKKVADLANLKLGEKFSINTNPSHYEGDNRPVENVYYDQVQAWIQALNELSQSGEPMLADLIPGHRKGDTYRLPTEAEWEFVARGRGQFNDVYHFGNNEAQLGDYAWYWTNSNQETHPVAQKKPLEVDGKEFFDMYGNVWEWTSDLYGDLIGGQDPQGPLLGLYRIKRGGSYRYHKDRVNSGNRQLRGAESREILDVGFRLVRTRP